ncbi:unnamed protein product [Lupinus luteus]|uniref:Homeobox-leucine zipper protein n=1 Tax=Lupinus luteus TaxID=3873 RepID=A0AAV1Y7Q0_LUPLU
MKRLGSSDSLGALITICPQTEEHNPRNNKYHVYGREFQSMLEGLEEEGYSIEETGHHSEKKRRLRVDQVKALEKKFEVENKLEPERKVKLAQELCLICIDLEEHNPRNNKYHVYGREFQSMLEGLEEEGYSIEETGHHSEKKRRLRVDQVKALEKKFEVENKLEPERKVKLAQELGLQPRQVAVWFQNRRARYKTKLLERDYCVLKASYDALKLNYDTLQKDNSALLKEIKELKSRVEEENNESDASVKEEMITLQQDSSEDLKYDCFNKKNNEGVGAGTLFSIDFDKDGASDSDFSATLNEEQNNNSPNYNPAISSSGVLQSHNFLMSPVLKFNNCSSLSSPSSMNCFQFQKANCYQARYVKMEERDFFSADEACNFFSDEQAPTLQWDCSEEWSQANKQ